MMSPWLEHSGSSRRQDRGVGALGDPAGGLEVSQRHRDEQGSIDLFACAQRPVSRDPFSSS
jgi:hypothetical protein